MDGLEQPTRVGSSGADAGRSEGDACAPNAQAEPHACADEHLGPHPDTPPDLPEPLASVTAAQWGDKSLATFTAAAAFPTLNDAGHALDIHRSSLLRTIRNVETAIGEPVLTDHSPAAPPHLTPTGRRLLQQAEQHRWLPRRAGRAS